MPRRRKGMWIQRALRNRKKGALHRQLGIPERQRIPLRVLERAATAPGKLGRRARLALTLRRLRRKRRRSPARRHSRRSRRTV